MLAYQIRHIAAGNKKQKGCHALALLIRIILLHKVTGTNATIE
jgi:hypothetical protein